MTMVHSINAGLDSWPPTAAAPQRACHIRRPRHSLSAQPMMLVLVCLFASALLCTTAHAASLRPSMSTRQAPAGLGIDLGISSRSPGVAQQIDCYQFANANQCAGAGLDINTATAEQRLSCAMGANGNLADCLQKCCVRREQQACATWAASAYASTGEGACTGGYVFVNNPTVVACRTDGTDCPDACCEYDSTSATCADVASSGICTQWGLYANRAAAPGMLCSNSEASNTCQEMCCSAQPQWRTCGEWAASVGQMCSSGPVPGNQQHVSCMGDVCKAICCGFF